jgi:hypothetical protein
LAIAWRVCECFLKLVVLRIKRECVQSSHVIAIAPALFRDATYRGADLRVLTRAALARSLKDTAPAVPGDPVPGKHGQEWLRVVEN